MLREKAPDVYNFARLIDTGIGRIEVFCEHPATRPPEIPIAPTKRKIYDYIGSIFVFKVRYKELTIHGALAIVT